MGNRLKLIFVHVPKAGGTSVASAIVEYFSRDRVLADCADYPIDPSSPMNIDPIGFLERSWQANAALLANKAAVCGHFWIAKYRNVEADVRATILREPISRAISHYCYWQQRFKPGHPLFSSISRLSFVEFVRIRALYSIYTTKFFRSIDMGQFDFIGAYDSLASDWTGTLRALGLDPPPPWRKLNVTAELNRDYLATRSEVLSDARMMAELRDLFADDLRFYERYAREGNC